MIAWRRCVAGDADRQSRSLRWLSPAAISAKRQRRRLERRWQHTELDTASPRQQAHQLVETGVLPRPASHAPQRTAGTAGD